MNPTEVISTLQNRGVSLWEERGALRYRAKVGTLTDSDKALLKAHKASILKALAPPTASASIESVGAKLEPPKAKDRLCYECHHFTRSSYGYPLGLCKQHDNRIQHTTSQPTQFGCGEFTFRQASDDSKTCLECRHYNQISTMCSQVNTGCPFPSIPPCSGEKFQHKLRAVRPNKEEIKGSQS